MSKRRRSPPTPAEHEDRIARRAQKVDSSRNTVVARAVAAPLGIPFGGAPPPEEVERILAAFLGTPGTLRPRLPLPPET